MTNGMTNLSKRRLKFFVALNTGYVTDGKLENRLSEFYRRRSSPALHCAIVGNVVIPGGSGTNARTPTISRGAEWTKLAGQISSGGSLPGIQLATTWQGYSASRSFRSPAGNTAIVRARELARALDWTEVKSVLTSLEEATNIAFEAGFRHFQVHAAHGYLFSLLVDRRFYPRAPDVLNWLSDWSLRRSAAYLETSIRISLRTGDNSFDAHGRDEFHGEIASLPLDFVDVSSGFYDINKQLIYPGRPEILLARRAETLDLANRFPQKRFIMSGRALLHPEHDLPANVHLGLCRDLIANPDYITDNHRGCINSGKCHYFSRGVEHLTCARWTNNDL